MKIFGLTGGIASGKSTVADIFREQGISVLDADSLYHQLIAPQNGLPSPLAQEIEAVFENVLNDDGTLNRAVLGDRIFKDPNARRHLNAVTHPAVGKAFKSAIEDLEKRGDTLALYDVPLLFEVGKEKEFTGVIVVWISEAQQRERLLARDPLTEEQVNDRLRSQLSLDLKRDRADYILDNSRSKAETREQVLALIDKLR